MMSLLFFYCLNLQAAPKPVTVGSKAFTEGYVLAELAAHTLTRSDPALKVVRRLGMGGTGILFAALKAGEIDVYSEYTGTIAEAILQNPKLQSVEDIRQALAPLGLTISDSLGFDDSYAIAVSQEVAEKYHLHTLSDLAAVTDKLRAGISHEFMSRSDGFEELKRRYQFHFAGEVQAMEHALTYEAVEKGRRRLTRRLFNGRQNRKAAFASARRQSARAAPVPSRLFGAS